MEEKKMVEEGSLLTSAVSPPLRCLSPMLPAVVPDLDLRENLNLDGFDIALETQLGTLVIGDCLEVLGHLPDDSLDLVVTSPPYDRQPKYGNGEKYGSDWYHGFFLQVTAEILRVLKPHGSFLLNYRSKRTAGGERGTLQYELVFLLRDQGFHFAEDFIWGKPSPPPGRFNRYLKDAVEYCFQFTKTDSWQFFPEHCLRPARWDRKDVERRKKLAHNFVRANAPSGQGRKRVQAGPDLVRPSTLLYVEPEFKPNPTRHPARFPVELPSFFINLLSLPGQIVFDPFAGTGTTAVAAEQLGRRWLASEIDARYAAALPSRLHRAG
ncbi:MAG: site-specific DNA-methyltransferase [Actinobacteria bacterium]|nr:site-specific DNA-methyltransferase [Actinomycetota bacterium]